MQTINRAIINPAFLGPFMGQPVVMTAGAIAQFRTATPDGKLMAASTATYAPA